MERVTHALHSALDCLAKASKATDKQQRDELCEAAREYMRLAVQLSENMTIPGEPHTPN